MKNIQMVTGTGSSGTTFLIELLEKLELTRCTYLPYNSKVKGGYEFTLYDKIGTNLMEYCPKIIKDPRFMFGDLKETVIKLRDLHRINVDHIFICFRDFDQSVKSRISRNLPFHSWKDLRGVGDTDYEKHIDFYRKCLQVTIEDCMKLNIEVTFINYDQMNDPVYLHKKLLRHYSNLELKNVKNAHSEIYIPNYKNSY